jgi:ubiquitin C-terminal hydrolase
MTQSSSVIHQFFVQDAENKSTFNCTLCNKFSTTTKDTTSTSFRLRHLKTKHPEALVEEEEINKKKQTKLTSLLKSK